MKNRFVLVLPLAASLMVPAFAQQQTGSSTATPADQSNVAAQPQAAQAEDDLSARQPLQPETRQGFWGHLNPFARKKYVQNQLSPIRNRVNELDELTAKNSRMVKDVDARATAGIRDASARASEADQHALDAGNRAQQANQTAQMASTRLQTVEQVVGNLDQYQPSQQVELRFRPGQVTLSKRDKDALDQIATDLQSQKGYIVEVQGFAPGHGQTAVQHSQKMADSVVRYLVLNHEIPVYRIYELGMGNARLQTAGTETTAKRSTRGNVSRVEVTLMKNGVDQLVQAAPANTYGSSDATQGGDIGSTPSGVSNNSEQTTTPANGVSAPPSQQQRYR